MTAPLISGIHHVKFPVSDLAASRAWYEKVFGLTVELEFRDDPDGPVMGLAFEPVNGAMIGLRQHPTVAAGIAGFDPISLAIEDREAAERWIRHLDDLGVEHSPIIDATIGWLIVFHDPDGIEHHLYTTAEHGLDQSGRAGYGARVSSAEP